MKSSDDGSVGPPHAPSVEAGRYIVGIGASAGGLEALERLFEKVPTDTGLVFVVVQHLSPDFKSLMDELLARCTDLPICAAEDGMPIAPDHVYLMPPKKEMILSDGRLLLTDKGPSDELTLPIDQFFRSLARDAGAKSIAIVLSGTGSDGSRGICDVHEAGGLVLVQSQETAKFDGMPRSAVETGIADQELAPEEMPAALLRHIGHPRAQDLASELDVDTSGMSLVFRLLRDAYGIDFSHYKPATVLRRTERRLELSHAADLENYVQRLQSDREELDALYRDLLIGVTCFFRDEEAFLALEKKVLPDLLKRLPPGEEFRAWVAGCATGEEAYSLAILVHEQLEKLGRPCTAKIFATDVHRASLETAGLGVYDEKAVESVSPERLHKYFSRNNDGYHVSTDVRQLVVFAPHNIIKDAPFTRLDLITCRNLLIYLQPAAQKKSLCLFHFGLKTGGALFLGPSESAGEISTEFDTIDQHWRLLRKRRDIRLPPDIRLPLGGSGLVRSRETAAATADRHTSDLYAALLENSLPPSVVVNEQREIVHTLGDASQFLRLRKGKPSLDVLEMLRDDLKLAAAGAIHRAARERKRVVFSHIRTNTSDGQRLVNLIATPVTTAREGMTYTLLTFEMEDSSAGEEQDAELNFAEASRDRVDALEIELRHTKENLQATIEELEASNEELQATNEEMLASNEELQSTNEELHSVNEELYTVNAEYQKKIAELTELTHDMDNLLLSTDVHTIFLDEQLCIRKFTPRMAEVFNLIPADVGRRIDGFMHTIACDGLQEKLADVLSHGQQYDEEVRNKAGDEFLMRILPYRGDTERSGVVMTLIDVTGLKQAEARFRNAVEAAPSGMLMANRYGEITLVNSEVERMFGYQREDLLGQQVEVLLPDRFRDRHVGFRQEYFQNARLRPMANGLDLWARRKDGSEFPVDVRLSPIATPQGTAVLAAIVDVADRKRLESSLRDQVTQRDRFLATLSHELRNPMGAILSASSMLNRVAGDAPETMAPLGVIRRQSSQLATLLDDLLDVSRVTQNKITLRREATDLTLLISDAIEAVAPLISSRCHQLHLDVPDQPLWIDADRSRMLQVVENLLTNAIKYTPKDGNIWVSLTSDGKQAAIRIRDDGRGIASHLLESIFDMFVQSDDTLDRSEGGMGVGLTLVRSLVELHDGKIHARSEGPGCGSEFTVNLPLTAKRPHRDISPAAAHSAQALRLVLVEDSDDAREMLAALLQAEGHQVLTAADGREGLELIVREKPDVALLDIGLPVMDGYQVARRVRRELGPHETFLIALTGYGREEDRAAVLEAGFNEHLVKPLKLEHLLAALDKSCPALAIDQRDGVQSQS